MASQFGPNFMGMIIFGMASVFLAGCGPENPIAAGCAAENMIGEICAGTPAAAICDGNACAQDVACVEVRNATSDADLSSALMGASAGTCITLAPGSYAAATLPGGVSLLGRSANDVNVAGVVLGAGKNAVIRGIFIGGGGVRVLAGATGARIESVRVASDGDGVSFDPGSSGFVVTSEVVSAKRVGIYAQNADVTLDRTVVHDASSSGISFSGTNCDATCACTSRPKFILQNTVIRDNHFLGAAVYGSDVEIDGLDVKGTKVGEGDNAGLYGGGFTAAACSDVSSKKLRVLDSASWGVLVDASTATLGADGMDEGIEIRNNWPGLWIQNVTCTPQIPDGPCVMVHNGLLEENLGVGIGVAGQSQGIILCKSKVARTQTVTMPVFDVNYQGGAKEVGDGVDWLDESEVRIDGLILSGNTRQSMLIDGPTGGLMGGKIWSMTLEGGDENKPPLQQNLAMGAQQPALSMGVTLATNSVRQFAVPKPQSVPTSM